MLTELETVLKAGSFTVGKRIGKGGYGIVHRATYRGKPIAAKVIYARRNEGLADQIRKFHTLFANTIAHHQKQREATGTHTDASHAVELAYFTEDALLPIPATQGRPAMYVHLMELLPGKDMKYYLREHGKTMTLHDVLVMLCSVWHVLMFFHEGGATFNDLKLENVMIHPQTKRATFIDYFDSHTQCTHTECAEEGDNIISTFDSDEFRDSAGFSEDVWRFALLTMDVLETVQRAKDDDLGDEHDGLPSDEVKGDIEESPPGRYPTNEIHRRVKDICDQITLTYRDDTSYPVPVATVQEQLRKTLLAMTVGALGRRPTTAQLMCVAPWNVCVPATPAAVSGSSMSSVPSDADLCPPTRLGVAVRTEKEAVASAAEVAAAYYAAKGADKGPGKGHVEPVTSSANIRAKIMPPATKPATKKKLSRAQVRTHMVKTFSAIRRSRSGKASRKRALSKAADPNPKLPRFAKALTKFTARAKKTSS